MPFEFLCIEYRVQKINDTLYNARALLFNKLLNEIKDQTGKTNKILKNKKSYAFFKYF